MDRLGIALAAALIAMVLAAAAAAAPPQTVVYPEQTVDTYAPGELCAFPVKIAIDAQDRRTTFFNDDTVHIVDHVTGGSISTNLATGAQLHSSWAFTARDVVYGFGEWTGRYGTVYGQDGGVIKMEAGRQILNGDIFTQMGRWDPPLDFCTALTTG
jgi:hypothetical protein